MHEGVSDYLAKFADDERGLALDIGGRDINGHPRPLWPNREWDVMDVRAGSGVTMVWDATRPLTMWLGDRYGLIICTETFEHVAAWPAIVANAYRWAKAGSLFLISCAGPGFAPHSGIDGEWRLLPGEHYRNVSAAEAGACMEAAGFELLDTTQDGRFSYAAGRKPGGADG